MEHYKSWSGLRQQLEDSLCQELKGRITYFLTRYHQVHNSYGRAAILLDGKELVCFSWIDGCRQEWELTEQRREDPNASYAELLASRKPHWDERGTYCEMDFLTAALRFRGMPISEALESEDFIVRVLAILDRRVGRRTLEKISEGGVYRQYPAWVRQFYELRLRGMPQEESL